MLSLAERSELVGFFSYSREDDSDSRGALSALRDRIQRELRGQLGRSARDFRVWQDKEAIAPGKLWESEITAAIAQSVFFIPIITPTAVRSDFCRLEFEAFLAREEALGRSDLIFPVLYIRVPALEDSTLWKADPMLSMIARRQYVDWRGFRHYDIYSTPVGEAIERFCSKIADALTRPDSSEAEREQREREKAEAEREAQEKAEQDRLEQERLAREKAEAERRAAEQAEAEQKAQEHFSLGAVLYDARDWDGAIREYQEALRLKPDNAEAHNNLGNALQAKQDWEGAVHEYREALRLKPDDAETHNNLGNALQAKRNWEGAVHEYREALRLKPDLHPDLKITVNDLVERVDRKENIFAVIVIISSLYIIAPGCFLGLWYGLNLRWLPSFLWSFLAFAIWLVTCMIIAFKLAVRRWGVRPFEKRFPDDGTERTIALSIIAEVATIKTNKGSAAQSLLKAIQGRL